ncbi:TPA: hypothetical protein ACH3X1_016543 [Trebouxia sp. C0004]
MQLFGWKLGVLHDRRDPKVIPSMTLNMSCRFSEQLAPAVCTACLLQISKAHTAKWPAHGFQLLQCPIDSRSLAGWHAHVTVARRHTVVLAQCFKPVAKTLHQSKVGSGPFFADGWCLACLQIAHIGLANYKLPGLWCL